MGLLQNSTFVLFLIVALGFMLGRIKINGISLDVSAVIFVALIFGHYGIRFTTEIQNIGLVLFIFTVGLQAGPGFIKSFKDSGVKLLFVSVSLVVIGAITTVIFAYIFHLDIDIATGLFTGALTSTPGLAVAIDATGSTTSSIGYGVAYPFGVIGVILFLRLAPRIFKLNLSQAEEELHKQQLEVNPEIFQATFNIENENIFGKSLSSIKLRSMTGATISRILHNGVASTPTPKTVLNAGDTVKAVGTNEALNKLALLIGSKTDQEIPLGKNYVVQSVLVTNKEVVNKSIKQLNLMTAFNANVTRIRRSGIDITPSSSSKIHYGDKLMISSDRESMKAVKRLLGNSEKKLSDTDFLPIAAGIALGIFVGKISILFPNGFAFKIGLTGGVLLTAIFLGAIGKTGPILWSMTGASNQLLRQLGLILFLSVVGTNAGASMVETLTTYGWKLFFIGAAITLIPLILVSALSFRFLKLNPISLMGSLAGGMTSAPGLAALTTTTDSNEASIAYAAVYPFAMVVLIIAVQLICLL